MAGFPAGTRPAIRDAAMVGPYLFIIPAGDAFDGCTLDVYNASSGVYRASLRLPIGLNVLTGRADDLVGVSLDEYPAIVRVRWNSAEFLRVMR